MKEKEAEQIDHGTNMQGDQRILDRIAKRFKSEVSGFAKASGHIKGTVFYDRQCPPGLCRTFSHRTCLSVAEQYASTMSKHLRSQGGARSPSSRFVSPCRSQRTADWLGSGVSIIRE